jgi:UDP:flavonoid glycosyltransferase YjiC (YdhE family)
VVSDEVIGPDYVPYSLLFPRMARVAHHGGAGTTGRALRAGIPNAVVPFTSEQPFWGPRVHELGAGPEPVPAPRVSAKRLGEAIAAVANGGDIRRRAELIGEAIRAEDGVGEAIGIIGRYLDVKQAGR